MEKYEYHNKQSLRSRYLNYRSSLSKSSRADKSRRIRERIMSNPVYQNAEIVLVYMDYRAEVETTELVEELLKAKEKRVFAPKVDGMDIYFYEITSFDDLSEGYQSIREPSAHPDKLFAKELSTEQCLVLVPGAVFDRQMGRMGYGKGFYDRFLGQFKEPYRMALAYDCQLAKNVPVEKHDIRMNAIITESEVIHAE